MKCQINNSKNCLEELVMTKEQPTVGLPAANQPGLEQLLAALQLGGQPQGNISQLPSLFTQLSPTVPLPQTPEMEQLQSPFAL